VRRIKAGRGGESPRRYDARAYFLVVMAGLDPAIHAFASQTWMAGTSPRV